MFWSIASRNRAKSAVRPVALRLTMPNATPVPGSINGPPELPAFTLASSWIIRARLDSAPHRRMLPSASASGVEAGQQTSVRSSALVCLAGPARLPALRRGACRSDRTLRLSPGRASRDAVRRRYLRLFIALKRCTSRAGRCADGDDARTARERGYKPRPQEPHSPHRSAVTGRRPFDERYSAANASEPVTDVNGNVTHGSRRRWVQSCGAKRAARLLTSP